MAETKVKAPPKARLYFYRNKNNGVSVKFNFLDKPFGGFSYIKGTKKSIRFNHDEDRDKYKLILGFSVLDSFLSCNGIKDGEVEIDPASIETFYGYDGVYAVNLTKSFVGNWWGYDCPVLSRYTVNKNYETNWTGLDFVYFQNILVEFSWSGACIGKDITEEEVKIFSEGREDTLIYKEMMNTLNSRDVTEESVSEMEAWIKDYESKIQQVIDNNKGIVMHVVDFFTYTGKEQSFGLDCGFLNIFTENKEYNAKKGLLKNLKSCAPWMDLNIPYNTQSITIKQKEFEKIKQVVFEQTGEKLYCQTVLD